MWRGKTKSERAKRRGLKNIEGPDQSCRGKTKSKGARQKIEGSDKRSRGRKKLKGLNKK